jgi:hypothetical protein
MKNTSHQFTLAAAFVVCASTIPAQAALLFYDGFAPNTVPTGPYDYQPGEPLAASPDPNGAQENGQYNENSTQASKYWRYIGSGAANQVAPKIASWSLSYPGLPASTGNKLAFDMTQIASARIQVANAISSDTVYWSGLFQVSAIDSTLNSVNGAMLGGFNNTVGPGASANAVGAVLRIRKDPTDGTKYDIGTAMQSGTGAGNIQWSSAFTPSTDTIFLVGAYEFVAGTNNDKAYMWINPSVSDFGALTPPAPTLTSAPGGSIADSFPSISTFNLRNVNTVGSATAVFDELRVGTDWASVTTPEPSAFVMMGLAGLFAFARRPDRQAYGS